MLFFIHKFYCLFACYFFYFKYKHPHSLAACGNFCLNIILSHHWEIETVQFMNNAVGCNVFTGICCLLMLMLGLLDKEEGSEAK